MKLKLWPTRIQSCRHQSYTKPTELIKWKILTSWACNLSLVSSTASFLVVNVLSRSDVLRTDCALECMKENQINFRRVTKNPSKIINSPVDFIGKLMQTAYQKKANKIIYLVLLLCERLTRLRWASANLLLSCSVLSCSIRSLISASSHIPTERIRKYCYENIQSEHSLYIFD